jgi:hypothetical protein
MRWEKKGLILDPDKYKNELGGSTKAFSPTVQVRKNSVRVYFSSSDKDEIGDIFFVDLDRDDLKKIIKVDGPVLKRGEVGRFDEHGVTPSCILESNGVVLMYYFGWMKTVLSPQLIFIGLAKSSTDYNFYFEKYLENPIIDRTYKGFISKSAPFVIKEERVFKMWYVGSTSGFYWKYNNKLVSKYTVRYAESEDGIHWSVNEDDDCLMLGEQEFGLSRPAVVYDGIYKMWYSVRRFDIPYRLGYAESNDGIHWERKDNMVGINVSEGGWDSNMICYPCIVDLDGKRLMFYNGNGYGTSGFGYAELCE